MVPLSLFTLYIWEVILNSKSCYLL